LLCDVGNIVVRASHTCSRHVVSSTPGRLPSHNNPGKSFTQMRLSASNAICYQSKDGDVVWLGT